MAIIAAGIPAAAQTGSNDQAPNSNTTTTPQYGKRGHRMHGMNMQRMAQRLNLSQQQQDQLKPIFVQSRQQAQAIRNDASLTPEQKKEKLQALRQSTHTQVNGILTPDQQQQMAQMRTQGMQRMAHRRQMISQRMAQKLNLSQQQQDQLKPIFENRRTQARAIWQDNALTREQKKDKLKALHQDTMAQVNSILTPEQQQQWQQMRENFKQRRHGRGGFGGPQVPVPQG